MGRRALPFLALSLLACAGCYQTEESDGTIVIGFASWVLLLVALAGAALALLGVAAVKSGAGGKAVAPLLLGGLALGVFLPGMAVDRVVVTSEEIRQTTGFWFAPTRKGFRYADVHSIRIEELTTSKGVPNAIWVVRYKNGKVESLDPGDLWEKSSDTIVPRLQEHGVDVR
jgi:hypothetical protein